MNLSLFVLFLLFIFLVFYPLFILGMARIYLWADYKLSALPSFVRISLACLLSICSYVIVYLAFITLIIGATEAFRQWKRYKERKRTSVKTVSSQSIWDELCQKDGRKMLMAYVMWPFYGVILEQKAQEALSNTYGHIFLNSSEYMLSMIASLTTVLGYLMFAFAPTLIRFVLVRRKLRYGTEICGCLIMSFFMSWYMCFYLTGMLLPSFGIIGTVAMYCILSYQSTEYRDEIFSVKFSPFLLTVAGLLCISLLSGIIAWDKQKDKKYFYVPIWEGITVCCILIMNKSRQTPQGINQISDAESQPELYEPAPPTHQPTPPDKPAQLTATALALIGRPTLHENEYLTPSMTKSRHETERPFVKILSATYRTDTERKAMSRHFMLWKEFAVFVALSQVLKSDKTLLAQTQIMLKERLNEGLPSDVLKKRVEIMRAMSGIFTADYKISGSLEQSFLRTFRETLPDGLPELPDSESVGGYLVGIYRFIYGRLKREYQGLRERERV